MNQIGDGKQLMYPVPIHFITVYLPYLFPKPSRPYVTFQDHHSSFIAFISSQSVPTYLSYPPIYLTEPTIKSQIVAA